MNETLASPARSTSGSRYLNRELSWLDFNERVLTLAEDPGLPLLERVRFLAIYESNLDEFFQVRVTGLREQAEAGVSAVTPEGLTPGEQLVAIADRVDGIWPSARRAARHRAQPRLSEAGIKLCHWAELSTRTAAGPRTSSRSDLSRPHAALGRSRAPVPLHLEPLAQPRGVVRDPMTGERRFARVKVPPLLPRFLRVGDSEPIRAARAGDRRAPHSCCSRGWTW